MIKKSGQAWSFDLMIALTIFVATISLFFFYSINFKSEGEDVLAAMQYDGNAVADILLSEGYPQNWDQSGVALIVPGILTNNRVNENKLIKFDSLTYDQQHSYMHTKYDFCFNFSVPLPDSINKPCIGSLSTNQDNLILISRMVIYQNKSSMLNIYIWK